MLFSVALSILIKPASAKGDMSATHILGDAPLHFAPGGRAWAKVVVFAVSHEYIMTTDAEEGVPLPGCAAASVLSFPLAQVPENVVVVFAGQLIFSQSALMLIASLGLPVTPHISVQ